MAIYTPPPAVAAAMSRVAVESRRLDRTSEESIQVLEQSSQEVEHAFQDLAEDQALQAAQAEGVVSVAQSAQQLYGAGQQAKEGARIIETKQAVEGLPKGTSAATLKDVQLTEHTKLGERYSDEQLAVLSGGGRFDEATLSKANFSATDKKDLLALQQKHGNAPVPKEAVADFIVDHRSGPKDQVAARGEKVRGEILKQLGEAPGRIYTVAQKNSQDQTQAAGERTQAATGMRDQLAGTVSLGAANARDLAAAASGRPR